MQYGYIRTDKIDAEKVQSLEKELDKFSVEKIFTDEGLPGTEIQPQLQALIDLLQPRDEIVTHACTSLSTDENLLQKIIAKVRNKKAKIRFIDLTDHGMENPILRARKAQNTQRWC